MPRRLTRLLCAAGFAALAPTLALAQSPPPASSLIREHIPELRKLLEAAVIDISVTSQNDRRKGIGEDQITALDQQWRAETKADDQPLIAAALTSPASTYLTQVQARSVGLYAALFVMDQYGLNVGQSVPTSDYWQGDEAKFQKTYPVGPDAVFIDSPEFNQDIKAWIVQVNLTLSKDGVPIGAATVDLNIDELTRRASFGR